MRDKLSAVFTDRPLSTDLGLLALRLGVGFSVFAFHGWSKLTGGPETWSKVGGAMGNLGLGFAPTFWGFMAALAESACALLLLLGLATRPAALLLGFTMFVAAVSHVQRPPDAPNAGWAAASHAIELLAACLCLFLAGPGRFALHRAVKRLTADDVPSPS